MHVVLIETSGNQHYIFATNKLRENVGASELTYQVGTKCVLEAIGKGDVVINDTDGNKLRSFLLNSDQNPFTDKDGDKIEVIIATSGKALLLVDDEDKAKQIVSEITKKGLIEMPGLTVQGAIESVEDDLKNIHDAVRRVHRKLEILRQSIPSNQQRFPRLPHVEPCATSGLPAREVYRHNSLEGKNDEWKPHSALSIAKQENSEAGRSRMEGTIRFLNKNAHLANNINALENTFEDTKWIAVIHADGNGIGEIFLNFDEYSNAQSGRDYVNKYRAFSIALDLCTLNAASVAIRNFQASFQDELKKKQKGLDTIQIPLIPLILGGDDLTIICDGQYAIKLIKDFLGEFEKETEHLDQLGHFKEITSKLPNGLVTRIANNAFGNKNANEPSIKHLGICAGVAIVKPHYPFHQAYQLAEQLLRSAKQVKQKIQHQRKSDDGKEEWVQMPSSSFDFHILYDSAHTELDVIRHHKLKVEAGTYLSAKPYVVTEAIDHDDNDWLKNRKFAELQKRVGAMSAPGKDDNSRRALPNSKLHEIRQSLFRGVKAANAETKLIQKRLSSDGQAQFAKLTEAGSVFFAEDEEMVTHFLDAIEAVDFWNGFAGAVPQTPINGNAPVAETNREVAK